MFVKGAVVASGVIAVGLAVSALNLPAVYNEMYPDDGLKRGVLGLCHEADLTFVRAAHGDRLSCYERMPHSIAVAIGWVRHAGGLIEPPPPKFGTLEAAELFLTNASAMKTQGALATLLTTDPAAPVTCDDPAKTSSRNAVAAAGASDPKPDDRSRGGIALLPTAPKAVPPQQALPVLPPKPAAETLAGPSQRPQRTAAARVKTAPPPGSGTVAPSLELGGVPVLDLDDRPAMSLSPRPPCPGA